MKEQDNIKEWMDLPATERTNYLSFHKTAYEEDLRHAEKNVLEFPRWSIISGYYCMHDMTKLFLAEHFNVKLSSPDIHLKAIEALEHFIKDDALKMKLLEMLKEAKSIYFSAERLKEKLLPVMLKRGRQERGRAQYYSEDYSEMEKTSSQKAAYFIETIVKPYIHILKGLR
ncbi:hypothetical protein J4468_04320 [Candidatus Woesearchaeota archaeon]|nr:hypothetical protein [Candidatus Woesearchaeota archaeon]